MKVFSATDAAKICGVTPAAFLKWIREGRVDNVQWLGNTSVLPADFKVKSRFNAELLSRFIPREEWQTDDAAKESQEDDSEAV